MPGVDGAETPEGETEAAVRIQAESHVAAGGGIISIQYFLDNFHWENVKSEING